MGKWCEEVDSSCNFFDMDPQLWCHYYTWGLFFGLELFRSMFIKNKCAKCGYVEGVINWNLTRQVPLLVIFNSTSYPIPIGGGFGQNPFALQKGSRKIQHATNPVARCIIKKSQSFLNIFNFSFYRCKKSDISSEGRGIERESLRITWGILQDAVPWWTRAIRKIVASFASSTLYWPKVPGASLLFQTDWWHTYWHLLDGDARGAKQQLKMLKTF